MKPDPQSVADAVERYENSGGFACSFPEEAMESLTIIAADHARLRQELEDTADKLSSLWIVLDACARGYLPLTPQAAATVLRQQKAPGWKRVAP